MFTCGGKVEVVGKTTSQYLTTHTTRAKRKKTRKRKQAGLR
jgi:hypothetical protein